MFVTNKAILDIHNMVVVFSTRVKGPNETDRQKNSSNEKIIEYYKEKVP